MQLRVLVHALDRTGPPMLAAGLVRWLRAHRTDVAIDVVAVRGGEMLPAFERMAPVTVLLEPNERWDPFVPEPERVEQLRAAHAGMDAVDATLLVSISAGEALPFLSASAGAVVTWVVEQGEAYPPGVIERTSVWLAGSDGTAEEVTRLVAPADILVCPEFVDDRVADGGDVATCRAAMGAEPGELLVVGAGIATERKGPDLFLEVAMASERRGLPFRFAWIGGERDPLYVPVVAEARRIGARHFSVLPGVDDVVPWFAAADVFLHTARLDAFPLVCLHAACAGTPVVAFSGVGGAGEMFAGSFSGAPYPDVEGLVDRLAECAEATHRERLGAAQQHRVRTNYVTEVGGPIVIAGIEHALAARQSAR